MKRKILSFLGVLVILFAVYGCGMEKSPKRSVELLLNNYQKNTDTIMGELNDYIKTLTSDSSEFESYKKVYSRQYQDLKYEIKDETIDGDHATVTAQIEVYDYYKANTDVSNYITSNPNEFMTDGTYDTNKGLLYRIGELSKSKDRVVYTININLTKVNNEWTIDNLTNEDLEKIHGTYAH